MGTIRMIVSHQIKGLSCLVVLFPSVSNSRCLRKTVTTQACTTTFTDCTLVLHRSFWFPNLTEHTDILWPSVLQLLFSATGKLLMPIAGRATGFQFDCIRFALKPLVLVYISCFLRTDNKQTPFLATDDVTDFFYPPFFIPLWSKASKQRVFHTWKPSYLGSFWLHFYFS